MFVQEQFVSINATPSTVEKHLTDPTLLAQWRSPLVVLENQQGAYLALGSTYTARLVTLLMAGAADYTVTERGSERIVLSIDGVWVGKELWRWWADGERTILQNRVEYDVPNMALSLIVGGLIRPLAELDMAVQLAKLRSLIETAAPRSTDTRKTQSIVVEE